MRQTTDSPLHPGSEGGVSNRPTPTPTTPTPPTSAQEAGLRPLTLLLDLADLPHRLLEDGAFVRLDVEAVDVAEVGRDQLRQLLDVLALLLPPLPLAPADGDGQVREGGVGRWRGQRLEANAS